MTSYSTAHGEDHVDAKATHQRLAARYPSWMRWDPDKKAFHSRNAWYSALVVNGLAAVVGVNAFFSIGAINGFFSFFSLNSVFSIFSLNSAFAIGCSGKAFQVCWPW
jgi:hypothetical protein